MHSRALVPVALVGTLLGGCADSTPAGLPAARLLGDAAAVASAAPGVTALTWNVYVGAEIERVAQAGSPEEAIQIATEQWANVQATNVPARAGPLPAASPPRGRRAAAPPAPPGLATEGRPPDPRHRH